GWIFRPGYPVVTVSRDAGGTLVLAQQRFNYLREPLPPAQAEPEQPWQVPIQLRVYAGSQATEERVLLADREARLRAGAGAEAVQAPRARPGRPGLHRAGLPAAPRRGRADRPAAGRLRTRARDRR